MVVYWEMRIKDGILGNTSNKGAKRIKDYSAVGWGQNHHDEVTATPSSIWSRANAVETEGTDDFSLNSESLFHFKIIRFGNHFRNGAVRTSKNIFPP